MSDHVQTFWRCRPAVRGVGSLAYFPDSYLCEARLSTDGGYWGLPGERWLADVVHKRPSAVAGESSLAEDDPLYSTAAQVRDKSGWRCP